MCPVWFSELLASVYPSRRGATQKSRSNLNARERVLVIKYNQNIFGIVFLFWPGLFQRILKLPHRTSHSELINSLDYAKSDCCMHISVRIYIRQMLIRRLLGTVKMWWGEFWFSQCFILAWRFRQQRWVISEIQTFYTRLLSRRGVKIWIRGQVLINWMYNRLWKAYYRHMFH